MQLPDPGGGGVVIDLTYTPATTTTTTTAAPTTTTTTTPTTHLTHTHTLPSVIDRAQHSLASIASSRTEIHIRGAADALAGIVDETTRLAAALGLIRDLECLQTPAVAAHARRVLQLAALLAGSMAVMAAESRRTQPRAEPQRRGRGQQQQQQQQQQQAKHRRGAAVGRTRGVEEGEGAGAAGAGAGAGDNREWRHLQVMWGQVGEVRRGLEGLVGGVCPGLRGDVRVGWAVARGEVMAVNEMVKRVMGVELGVVRCLGGRLEGSDDIIKLGDAEAAQLGLPQTTTARVVQWRDSLRE